MDYIIEKYINNITINNINDFALKNNIVLTEKEQKIFYDIVKNHYKEILSGNDTKIIKKLSNELDNSTFNKVMNLYEFYKAKYRGYL